MHTFGVQQLRTMPIHREFRGANGARILSERQWGTVREYYSQDGRGWSSPDRCMDMRPADISEGTRAASVQEEALADLLTTRYQHRTACEKEEVMGWSMG
jgi:hypothetical protein